MKLHSFQTTRTERQEPTAGYAYLVGKAEKNKSVLDRNRVKADTEPSPKTGLKIKCNIDE